MMKFSTAVRTVIREMGSDVKAHWDKLLVNVDKAFTWSNMKRLMFMPFRAAYHIGRFIGLTLRECFLNMMVGILSGVLPLILWVARISLIALPIAYAVPPSYGLTDFVWPALIGSAALYMVVSFLVKVFGLMLTNDKVKQMNNIHELSRKETDKFNQKDIKEDVKDYKA